ncbi:hypothetical protein [Corynebacterium halotolerans]|uniref:DAGKc domain-containing protein n=1 Tax=Corynebacterium halotolerans YIM 70093 = DSM 44683 TaxID=1121362 RepID=M1PA27_9CORY|nr:hypothetical protein [Corynebacterium halotolerans]AGF73506.1 hypothetical protein A605_12550 [Corynebacterium halotolerans YIM 70093 = DSM 44683]
MRLLILRCGNALPEVTPDEVDTLLHRAGTDARVEIHELSEVPARSELRFLDEAAKEILPEDPTPSLGEIAARPDVEHLATPQSAPQAPYLTERLRVVVLGTDAALSAVLTRMMRADHLWAEVGFVPAAGTTAGRGWGLPGAPSQAVELAVTGRVRPVPVIRTDAGVAVAGSATISQWDGTELTGEIIVDDHVLVRHEGNPAVRFHGVFGARLVPMTDAPGIAAVRAVSPIETVPAPGDSEGIHAPSAGGPGLRGRIGLSIANSFSPEITQQLSERPLTGWFLQRTPTIRGRLDADSLATGRAIQAGGPELAVTVDGVRHKRPLERVTFYRHLRDLQIVRP